MPKPRLLLLLAFAACALAAPAPALAQQDGVERGALYRSGPDTRHLLGGEWLFRLDPGDRGIREGLQRSASRTGWAPVAVPNAWNATDESDASMAGSIGWYRKDFRLPSRAARLSWVVRFESVNYRAQVWLNGRKLGENRGAYLPFELRLPAAALRRGGTNRLVVRVDNRRRPTDFPPSGLSVDERPTGGWWNYGGILREVYLREVDGIDLADVLARPELPDPAGDATVLLGATARNLGTTTRTTTLTAAFGGRRVTLGRVAIAPGQARRLERRITVRRPRLWAPGSPNLYAVRVAARVGGEAVVTWRLETGIRSVTVVDGRLHLNGRALNVRGMGLHEDDPDRGFAIDNARRREIVQQVQDVGATMLRSHYPLHPYIHELADRAGLLVWSEIPVYAVKTQYLKQRLVRALAANELADNIEANQNHPSVVVWSIGNELSARPGPVQGLYIQRAARQAKALDPTRPVGYAVAGYPSAGCQPEYAPLDVIGVNDYFGWYPGPNGIIADRDDLSGYLDEVRACYRDKAVMVTEFGAEANRSGPLEERGTYEFQQDFVNFHLGVYATKPWLSGALYWTIQEFRVRPGWEGGNPRPQPPVHQKGLLTFRGGQPKPAYGDLQRWFRGTEQLAGAGAAGPPPVRR